MMNVEDIIELLEKVKTKDACVIDEAGQFINDVEVRHSMANDLVIVVLKH